MNSEENRPTNGPDDSHFAKERLGQSGDSDSTELPPLSSAGPIDPTSIGPESDFDFESSETTMQMIGPYRIIREIGEGGMGSVYEAEQTEPVKRKVAIKVIRAGRFGKQVMARFQAERQALALMDHPSIARIIDAGETQLRQPYLAMELVSGRPLTEYCDANRLSIDERLSLFCQICDGMQHAHQKGIIHRDLKPGNILVTQYDGKPVPKIIDFGLAKALETTEKLTDGTLHTEFGQILGTIKYMSPEQAGLDSLDIDTRSDIYSLGIILYELLTGSTPLESKSIHQNALVKVLEIVRDQEVPKPSSRLSTDTQRLSTISARRQIEPAQLNSILTGELDWVVLKALNKERALRYSSASEFADDVRRYLSNDPVFARPLSRRYQLQKFVRKNRGLVASIATIMAVLVVGVLGTTSFALVASANAKRATENETKANESAKKERSAKLDAIKQKDLAKQEAEKERRTAKRIHDVLTIVTDSFRSITPRKGGDADMLARDVIDNAKFSLIDSTIDDLGRAILLETLEDAYSGVGDDSSSLEMAERLVEARRKLVGEKSNSMLSAKTDLGQALRRVGRPDEAKLVLEDVLETKAEQSLPVDFVTVRAMSSLAAAENGLGEIDRAIELLENAHRLIETNSLDRSHQVADVVAGNLIAIYSASNRYTDALKLGEELVKERQDRLGPSNPSVISAKNNLGGVLSNLGKHKDALKLYESLLETAEKSLGTYHPGYFDVLGNLANEYEHAGRLGDALECYNKTYQLRLAKLGELHPKTIHSLRVVAHHHYTAGNLAAATELSEKVSNLARQKFPNVHPEVLRCRILEAAIQTENHDYDVALQTLEEVLSIAEEKYGAVHDTTMNAMIGLAKLYQNSGKPAEAAKQYRKLLENCTEQLGPNHPKTLGATNGLGVALQAAGNLREANSVFERAVKGFEETYAYVHPNTVNAKHNLAAAMVAMGKTAEALKHLEQVVAHAKTIYDESNTQRLVYSNSLAAALIKLGRFQEAIPVVQQVYQLQVKQLGPENRETLTSLNNLAAAQYYSKQITEALETFEKILEIQTRILKADHPNRLSTIGSLAAIYANSGNLEKGIQMTKMTVDLLNPEKTKNTNALSRLVNLANMYEMAGQTSNAKETYERFMPLGQEVFGPTHRTTHRGVNGLARILLKEQDYERSAELVREIANEPVPENLTPFAELEYWEAKSISILANAKLGMKNDELSKAKTDIIAAYKDVPRLLQAGPAPIQKRVRIRFIERIIDLIELTDDQTALELWQAKLNEVQASSQ